MPKKPIIIISVLCVISLALGYLSGLKDEDSLSNGDAETNSKKEPEFLKEGLVAYYPFNGNAKDESGNGNDGEVIGATFEDDRHRMNQRACFFDGDYDFIEIRHSETVSFSSPDYTITVWLKYGLPTPPAAVFVKALGYGTGYQGPTVFTEYTKDGKISFRERRGSEIISDKSALADNVWRHFAFMKRGLLYSVFINGILDSSFEKDLGDARINNNSIWIGANHEDQKKQNYNGLADDIRIYNRALSAEEVKALYEFEKAN